MGLFLCRVIQKLITSLEDGEETIPMDDVQETKWQQIIRYTKNVLYFIFMIVLIIWCINHPANFRSNKGDDQQKIFIENLQRKIIEK